MPVLNPDHLLDQADRLTATLGVGPPRQADLRRAISSSYYALFHSVLIEAADEFIGRTKRDTSRYALVYRSVTHRSLRALCEDVAKSKMPNKYDIYVPRGGFDADLRSLATAVVDLQEKRHLADYDPMYRVRTSDAVLAVATGRAALSRFRRATRAQRRAFVSLLLFSPR
jgi:hypothetical protein